MVRSAGGERTLVRLPSEPGRAHSGAANGGCTQCHGCTRLPHTPTTDPQIPDTDQIHDNTATSLGPWYIATHVHVLASPPVQPLCHITPLRHLHARALASGPSVQVRAPHYSRWPLRHEYISGCRYVRDGAWTHVRARAYMVDQTMAHALVISQGHVNIQLCSPLQVPCMTLCRESVLSIQVCVCMGTVRLRCVRECK